MNKELKNYKLATNKLVEAFVTKCFGAEYFTWYDETSYSITQDNQLGCEFKAIDGYDDGVQVEGFWIDKEVGGILCIDDYFFSVNRMVEAISLDASKKHLLEFEDLEIEVRAKSKKPTKTGLTLKFYIETQTK